ncbi:hypothetical protein ES703_113136 [subsurface metagenome]
MAPAGGGTGGSANSIMTISLRGSPSAVRPMVPSSIVTLASPSSDTAVTDSTNLPVASTEPDTSVAPGSGAGGRDTPGKRATGAAVIVNEYSDDKNLFGAGVT